MTNQRAIKDAVEINNRELWVKPSNPVAVEQRENENIKLVQGFFTAYGDTDPVKRLEGIKAVMASDVEWHIPGRHKLAGTKKGIDEVLEFFGRLGDLKFGAQPMIFAANESYVIDAHRGFSEAGEGIDINWILIYQIENEKIKRVQNFSGDLYASDKFFDSVL